MNLEIFLKNLIIFVLTIIIGCNEQRTLPQKYQEVWEINIDDKTHIITGDCFKNSPLWGTIEVSCFMDMNNENFSAEGNSVSLRRLK